MASILNVDNIQSATDNLAVSLTYGGVISSGYALTCSGGINVSGVVTATSFSGDGSGLTNLPGLSNSGAVAFKRILSFSEFRT